MKRFYIVLPLGLFFCGVLLSGLWVVLQPREEPEKAILYKSPVENTTLIKRAQIPRTGNPASKTEHANENPTDEAEDTVDLLLTKYGFTPEEEAAFWEWLAAQKKWNLSIVESVSDEQLQIDTQKEGSTLANIRLSMLLTPVISAYMLEDVLKEYGIEFVRGRAICPFCSQRTFRTTVDGSTGRRDFWRCRNCTHGPKRVTDFIARMEGISSAQVLVFLAEDLGLLE